MILNAQTGYTLAGQDGSNNFVSAIQALAFPNDTAACVAKGNAPSNNIGGGTANFPALNSTYVIAGAGGNFANSNAILAHFWTTDTSAPISKGTATVARGYGLAGFSSGSQSYASGGSGGLTTVDGIAVATDTMNAVAKGYLPSGKSQTSGGQGLWS